MREIKFRLHDKDTGVTRIYTLSKLIGTTFRRGKFQFRGRFTGLKDKNGKEIYEGDVVIKTTKRLNKKYPDLIEKFEVRWLDGCFYQHTFWFSEDKYSMPINEDGTPQYLDDQIFWLENGKDMEVIGNLYENPKLLTK